VPSDSDLDKLDPGEKAAIVLAEQQKADLIVIDDLLGRQVAKSRGRFTRGDRSSATNHISSLGTVD